MAFISIVLLDLAFVAFELMVVFGMVALGVLGFVLCVVCLILWKLHTHPKPEDLYVNRKKERQPTTKPTREER